MPLTWRPSRPAGAIWGALQQRFRGADSNPGRAARLDTILGDLAGVGVSTEGVFLLVGERLAGLQLRIREIVVQTAAVAELLSNDAGSLSALDEVLSATGRPRRHDSFVAAIREIQQGAQSIHRAMQGLQPVVKSFDVLGVMTRVESARFEGAGAAFVGLADSVTALSAQIREQMGAAADSAGVLLETTAGAAQQLRQVEQKRGENLAPLARQTSEELRKIREHREAVSRATRVLGARFESIAAAIGDVVTALQSHDIVRQQVEHVLEALRRAESAGCDLSAVARLQAAQLDNSRETFERSVREIRGALDRIEQDVEEVATEAARLLGLSGAGQASFFSGVQTDLLGILTILESNAAAASGLAEAAVSVHQRVDAITGTAAGVRAIGLAMQRIALNAAIQAARLGQDGAALEIVAQSIQGLARETETASATLENRVLAIREAAGVLSGAEADCRGSDEQVARLGGAAGALHSIQQEAHRGCARAGELAGRLKERVRETSAAFAAGGDCLPLLGAAAEELRGLSPGASSPLAAEVEHMKSIYTMQSERGVHESLCKTVSGEPVDTEEDNVEFF